LTTNSFEFIEECDVSLATLHSILVTIGIIYLFISLFILFICLFISSSLASFLPLPLSFPLFLPSFFYSKCSFCANFDRIITIPY